MEKDLEIIEKALNEADKDAAAEEMAEILMDENIYTYGMFEDLASGYMNSDSEDFRKGIDFAVRIFTEQSLAKLSETMLDASKEKDLL